MNPATYLRPESLEQAAKLHTDFAEARYLSGGHTLLPAMKQGLARPSHLIDLGAIEGLRGIAFDAENKALLIGAATRHVEVASSAEVLEHIPALAGLAGSIGDRQVRNRGTIGGSVANNDPAADYPSSVLGLGATVVTDRREIPADEFFTGLFETALAPGEMIVQVRMPIPLAAGYAKFRSAASRYSLVGVFVARTAQGVRVAVTGAGEGGVFRATALEAALNRDFSAQALADLRVDAAGLLNDLNATPAYRANLIMVMARQAVSHMGQVSSFK
ncbi:MAG TPA: xanthine dehydrogenase family protein subunit M [Burkholderiales bacterium]|jgi:carbon-monoxide dehydrogenase medium subunit|nr:xanthine dehydrogenase family protein subunit M [Burkholderiales bacterium]